MTVSSTANVTNHGRIKYPLDFLLAVPSQLKAGRTLAELAESVGGTRDSLYQILRKHKIEISRRPNKRAAEGRVRTFLNVKQTSMVLANAKASARGMSCAQLLERLIDTIAEDDMFDAVLDDNK